MRDIMHLCVYRPPVGNVFVKDFVEFMVTGKKVTGRVHGFICFEEKVGFLYRGS